MLKFLRNHCRFKKPSIDLPSEFQSEDLDTQQLSSWHPTTTRQTEIRPNISTKRNRVSGGISDRLSADGVDSEIESLRMIQQQQEERQEKKQHRLHRLLFLSPRTISVKSSRAESYLASILDKRTDPLTGLLAFCCLPFKDSDLKPETFGAAFSKLMCLIDSVRTGTDFSNVCRVVRLLLKRTQTCTCFGLIFLANAELQRRIIATIDDTAFEFLIRLQLYCHDHQYPLPSTNFLSDLSSNRLHSKVSAYDPNFVQRGIQTADDSPIHLPAHNWSILSLLVVVGRLLAETNVDFAVQMATNQLFSQSLGRLVIEGLTFHATVYFIQQSIRTSLDPSAIGPSAGIHFMTNGAGTQTSSKVSSDLYSHQDLLSFPSTVIPSPFPSNSPSFVPSNYLQPTAESSHIKDSCYSPIQSPSALHHCHSFPLPCNEGNHLSQYRMSINSNYKLPLNTSQICSSNVMFLGPSFPTDVGVSFPVNRAKYREMKRKINWFPFKSPSLAAKREGLKGFENEYFSPRSDSDHPPPTTNSQFYSNHFYPFHRSGNSQESSTWKVECSDGIQETGIRTITSYGSSVWDGTLSPKTAMTLGEISVDQDIKSVNGPWTLDTFSAKRGRLKVMKIIPQSLDQFIFGCICVNIATIPNIETKVLMIFEYLSNASECEHLVISSGLPLLNAILSCEPLYQLISSSVPALCAMLHLFKRIIRLVMGSGASFDSLQSSSQMKDGEKRRRSIIPVANTSGSSSITSSISHRQKHQQQNKTKPSEQLLRNLWSRFFRKKHSQMDCTLLPEFQAQSGERNISQETVEEIKSLCISFLLKLGGSCKFHYFHLTDEQTRPMHFGVSVETLIAGNSSGRLTRGMLTKCDDPSILCLRNEIDSFNFIIEFLALHHDSASWQAALGMSPLDALLVVENISLVSRKDGNPLPQSKSVTKSFTKFSRCCYCGKNCYTDQVSLKPSKKSTIICSCNLVRYCNVQCFKLDDKLHRQFCHGSTLFYLI